MNLDKDFFWGIGLGLVAGALGYKLYNDNKQTIIASLENFKNKMSTAVPGDNALAAAGEQAGNIDLAELERQKEHLEDLIAEQQSKMTQASEATQS